MTIREIHQEDDPVLRKKAVKVTGFGKKFQTLVDDMTETMLAAPGVGLAAPQVGASQRLIVVKLLDDEENRRVYGEQAGVLYVIANPKIIKASREMVTAVEACLSVAGYFGEVERHESIVVTGLDRHGEDLRVKATGWLARVFQHEIDHLDGVLYTDLATKIWRADETPPADEETAAATEAPQPETASE